MKKSKHIIAIIIVLAVIAGVTTLLLPRLAESELLESKSDENATEETVVEETETDTIPFKEKLKEELQTIQSTYSRRKKKEIWTLGRGQSIITYLLQAQRFVTKKGGRILYMEELHNDQALQSAKLDLIQPDQDTLRVELQVSESVFRDDASVLAVVFQVTSLNSELISELNKLDYPYSLLVPPFGMSSSFYPDLDKVKNAELALWMTLESTKLNKVHNKLRPLRIHHTEEQIETVIDEAKALIPSAKGVISRYGEQAVEHGQLLNAILKPTKKNHLWFIDATMNSRSKAPEACANLNMKCQVSTYYNPENSALNDYIKQRMRDARKRGLSTMIIPLSADNLSKVRDLSEKAKNQGTSLVYLSKFMEY